MEPFYQAKEMIRRLFASQNVAEAYAWRDMTLKHEVINTFHGTYTLLQNHFDRCIAYLELNLAYKTNNFTEKVMRKLKKMEHYKDKTVVTFIQYYQSRGFQSKCKKILSLQMEEGKWKIISEGSYPLIREDLVKERRRERQKLKASIKEFISRWKKAWEGKRLDEYMLCYSKKRFRSKDKGWSEWKAYKTFLNNKYSTINIKIEDLKIIRVRSPVIVRFIQRYTSDGYADVGIKRLWLEKEKWAMEDNSRTVEPFVRPTRFPLGGGYEK